MTHQILMTQRRSSVEAGPIHSWMGYGTFGDFSCRGTSGSHSQTHFKVLCSYHPMPPADRLHDGITVGGIFSGDAGWAVTAAPNGVGLFFGLQHEGRANDNEMNFGSQTELSYR